MSERDRFEAWAQTHFGVSKIVRFESEGPFTGEYTALCVETAWLAWQARAAAEVPRDPRRNMVEAGAAAFLARNGESWQIVTADICAIWYAMHDAARGRDG